jgi:hypothetical protein
LPYNAQLTQHFDYEAQIFRFPVLIFQFCFTLNCNQPVISSSLLISRDLLARLPFAVFIHLAIFSPQEVAFSFSFSSTKYVSIPISVYFTISFFFCSTTLIFLTVKAIFFIEFFIYHRSIFFDV